MEPLQWTDRIFVLLPIYQDKTKLIFVSAQHIPPELQHPRQWRLFTMLLPHRLMMHAFPTKPERFPRVNT